MQIVLGWNPPLAPKASTNAVHTMSVPHSCRLNNNTQNTSTAATQQSQTASKALIETATSVSDATHSRDDLRSSSESF